MTIGKIFKLIVIFVVGLTALGIINISYKHIAPVTALYWS